MYGAKLMIRHKADLGFRICLCSLYNIVFRVDSHFGTAISCSEKYLIVNSPCSACASSAHFPAIQLVRRVRSKACPPHRSSSFLARFRRRRSSGCPGRRRSAIDILCTRYALRGSKCSIGRVDIAEFSAGIVRVSIAHHVRRTIDGIA